MSERTWRGDWITRIYQYVEARGFTSVSAFAATRPTATLLELASELGDDVAALQLEGVLHAEAEKTGEVDIFARDLLARCIREALPIGWDAGENLAFERAGAFANWVVGVKGLLEEATRDAVWDALNRAEIPTGWLPSGPDDPIIACAFAGVHLDVPSHQD